MPLTLLHTLLNTIHQDGGTLTAKLGIHESTTRAVELVQQVFSQRDALRLAREDIAALRLDVVRLQTEVDRLKDEAG